MMATPVPGTTLPRARHVYMVLVAGAQYKLTVGSAMGQGDIANDTSPERLSL